MNGIGVTENRSARLLRRLRKWAVFGVLFAGFGAGAIGLQHARLRQIGSYRPYIDSLQIPRFQNAKSLAFGYNEVFADFLFLRGVQAFGGQWKLAGAVQEMAARFLHYFDFMTDLDPHFFSAYTFGSMVVGEDGKDVRGANDLLRKGWENNPDKYRLPYLAYYNSWYVMKNDKLARFWLARAMRAPDAPDWIRRQQTLVDKKSGRRQAAMERWIWEFLNSQGTRDTHMADLARKHFLEDTDEWNRDILNRAVREYMKDHEDRLPDDLSTLDKAGYLRDHEACDYYRLADMLAALESSRGRALDRLSDIVAAVFVKRSGIPPTPFDPNPARDFYFLRKDVLPRDYSEAFDDLQMVVCVTWTRGYLSNVLLPIVRERVAEFQASRYRSPFFLEEAFPGGLNLHDPLTGTWNYNPFTGRVSSPSNPDL